MKTRRVLFITCAVVAVLVIAGIVGSAYWAAHKQRPFENASELISGLQRFARDTKAAGRQLPREISLQDLVRGGYLTTNDVRAFEGMEVTLSTEADDTQPQMILARARTPDGQFICLLADGSVQQFSASRLKEALRNTGQSDSTNATPARSKTNSALTRSLRP